MSHREALSLDGLDVRVRSTAGDVSGPVFVLLHGLGMSHRYLRRLQSELARSGATHAITLPGFGGTPKPAGAMSIEAGASLLEDTLDDLGITGVVLVGHSMGAQFVTELAARRPTLVTHLVLIGPVTDPRRSHPLVHAFDLVRDALQEPPSGNAVTFADYLRCGPRWYLTELAPMLAYRTADRLHSVHAPTLVIRGQNDQVARGAWCSRLVDAASDGTLVEIPGHRHLVQHSAPGLTAAAICEFARRERRRPGLGDAQGV